MVVRVFFNGEHDHNIKAIINDHGFDLGRWDSKALHARSLVALPPSERLAKQCYYKSGHSYFKGISHTPLFAITLPFSMPISPHQNACINFNVYKHFKFYVDAFRPSMFSSETLVDGTAHVWIQDSNLPIIIYIIKWHWRGYWKIHVVIIMKESKHK